jgi:hypothetical protein
MALCVYKRIRPDPIRLNLSGKLVIVRGGQTIVADNSQMLGVPGFAFVGFYNHRDNFEPAATNVAITRPKPIVEQIMNPNVIEVSFENIERQIEPPKPVIEKVQEVIIEDKPKVESQRSDGFAKDIIEKLKSFDNKQWFALRKEEIVKFLDDAGIEYKHISSDKWELLKFLKKIIKEL